MNSPVTYLFVPGDRPERFTKALDSGADAVILDLEDAVAADAKNRARNEILQFVRAQPAQIARLVVRINDTASTWFAADLVLVREAAVLHVMLPKVESTAQVALVRQVLSPTGRVLPLIETARGVRDVDAIAAMQGVSRLVFGTLDYGVDLNQSGDERGLIYPASRIVIASRCAGLASAVAGVTPAIDNESLLQADIDFARAMGFGAKLCIHPRQVAAIRSGFAPSTADIAWAERMLAAAAGAKGAVAVDGRMVDRPVLLKAQSILDRVQR